MRGMIKGHAGCGDAPAGGRTFFLDLFGEANRPDGNQAKMTNWEAVDRLREVPG